LNPAAPSPLRAACALAVLALLPACGKRGDPLAPLPRTPQPVTGLSVAQRGRNLEVAYVAPRATTGGVALSAMEVEVLRAETEGDFAKVAHGGSRKAGPGETLRDTLPLPAPGTQVRIAARAHTGGRVSALSPVVSLTVLAPLEAPTDLKAELVPRGVALTWTAPPGGIPPPIPPPSPSPSPSPSPRAGSSTPPRPSAVAPSSPSSSPAPAGSPSPAPGVSPSPSPAPTPTPSPTPPPPPSSGYWIYRRDSGGAYGAPLVRAPLQVASFKDEGVASGQSVCYVSRLVASTEPVIESEPSNEACVTVKDVEAPAAPTGVAALARDGGVEVSWSPSSEPDLAAYRVYRAAAGAPPERLAEVGAGESSYRDTAVAAGVTHVYTVTAVDAAGNESPPSAPAEGGLP
jgi:hypothetical protein